MPGARGEETLGDAKILFTNRALAEVEEMTGQSIVALLRGFQEDTAGMRELVHLVRAGLQAARRDEGRGGRPVSLDEVYEVLDEAGYAPALLAVTQAIAAVLVHNAAADPNP